MKEPSPVQLAEKSFEVSILLPSMILPFHQPFSHFYIPSFLCHYMSFAPV